MFSRVAIKRLEYKKWPFFRKGRYLVFLNEHPKEKEVSRVIIGGTKVEVKFYKRIKENDKTTIVYRSERVPTPTLTC